MAADGFAWWVRRLRAALEQADLVRIDHFRGFAACWTIPAHASTAQDGHWEPTPGAALLAPRATRAATPALPASTPAARGPLVAPGHRAVVTPNGSTLPLRRVGDVKVGHLVAEEVDHAFAPGLRVTAWGYNGGTPGPNDR